MTRDKARGSREKQQSAERGRGGGRLHLQKEAVAAVEKRGWLSHTTISHKRGGQGGSGSVRGRI